MACWRSFVKIRMSVVATACVRIVVLGLLLGISGAARAATEAERITQVLKAEYEQPGRPLLVDPVSIEGDFAIAGWSQGSNGGRALLQRTGAHWQVTLCAGDALLQPATLTRAGMQRDTAGRLVAAARRAESRLPAASRERFARFAGIVRPASSGALSISNVWARATPAGVDVGGAYFTILNRGHQPDTLLSLASPAASMVELHRTTIENGLARMRPAGAVEIAPGQTVTAGPGGLHVMLVGLQRPLVAGSRVPLVLTFRRAGAITVQVDVQPATFTPHAGHAGH
jgi:copper(I)-binding protein